MKTELTSIAEIVFEIRRMIRVHEMETGKRPDVVNMDLLPITVDGVRLEFSSCGNYTAHDGRVIHHTFRR